ncbi:hypothetical protein AB0C01_13960 [Micromonospora sp. NPDC048905]|uniref:hypothetical protein n=1 Tax=Micromonospora sp. NPDC048905 TaxID=3155494 RepID=UPI0033DF866F
MTTSAYVDKLLVVETGRRCARPGVPPVEGHWDERRRRLQGLARPHRLAGTDRQYAGLQWLSDSVNKSPQSRRVADMAMADPKWRDEQVSLADQVSEQLRAIIDRLLKSQG